MCALCKRLQALDKAKEREDGLNLGRAVAQYRGPLKRFLASHNEEVRTASPFGEIHLFSERLNADILREWHMRLAEVLCKLNGDAFCFVANVDEGETQARLLRLRDDLAATRYLEHRAGRAQGCAGEEMASEVVVARAPRDALSAAHKLKAGVAPRSAAADKVACK